MVRSRRSLCQQAVPTLRSLAAGGGWPGLAHHASGPSSPAVLVELSVPRGFGYARSYRLEGEKMKVETLQP